MRLTEAQLARYHEDGVLVLPGLFSAAEVAALRRPLARLFAEDAPENFREKASGEVRTAMGLHLRDETYARAARHPRLVEPAWQILGDQRLYIQQDKVNAKPAFAGEVWQWHYDFATHHNEDGVPAPLALNLHILLDEASEFNGPLWFIRGSHRHGPAPAALDTATTSYPLWCVDRDTVARLVAEGDILSTKGPPGTVLIFGDLMVHGSPPNMSPWHRRIYSLILNPVANAPTKKTRRDHQHHRDLTPVVPLADDCLVAPAGGGGVTQFATEAR
ncbi:MAG: phytanoyl-CoA dioxygenase family protein [Kiloniellales bacterium]|nr:phytanoyl-CoA dioxygenase family protein [Kiloniellales bacterium]